MRLPLACLLVLGLTQCAPPPPPPQAAGPLFTEDPVADAKYCARPQEKTAFQVAALKTRLMVTALACDSTDDYNAFIVRNRAGLLPQEKTLGGYFSRNYGRRGQVEQDEYITSLANAQSRRRTMNPAQFCKEGGELFAEVARMKSPDELPPLASTKTISQPMNVTECPASAPAPARSAPARSARR